MKGFHVSWKKSMKNFCLLRNYLWVLSSLRLCKVWWAFSSHLLNICSVSIPRAAESEDEAHQPGGVLGPDTKAAKGYVMHWAGARILPGKPSPRMAMLPVRAQWHPRFPWFHRFLCIRPGQEAERPRTCLSGVQQVHIDPNTVVLLEVSGGCMQVGAQRSVVCFLLGTGSTVLLSG